MALGLKYGRSWRNFKKWDGNTRVNHYKIFRKFYRWFQNEYGTVYCRELIKFDLTNPHERKEFFASSTAEECYKRVGKVARYVAEKILEEN